MNQNSPLSVVILAAGKGTRMKSSRAKVLHEVFYKTMLHHVLDAVLPLKPQRTVVIVGHQKEAVVDSLTGYDVETVTQVEQLGTGHAVQMTEPAIADDNGMVMILCGDSPLIRTSSLEKMIESQRSGQTDITVMTTILEKPWGYGRIISTNDNILAIVEEKEANDAQKQIKEINAGIYLVGRKMLFEALANIRPDNSQGEFYLTDIVEYAVSRGKTVCKFTNPSAEEILGVNSKKELEAAHDRLQQQRNIALMQLGITMHNSSTISVSPSSTIGCDTLLMQNVQISGQTDIGESCVIESGVVIQDCNIGKGVHIGANSVLKRCTITGSTKIPPLSYLAEE